MNKEKKSILIFCLCLGMAGSLVQAQDSYALTINSTFPYRFTGDFAGVVYSPSYTLTSQTPFTLNISPLAEQENQSGCGGISSTGYWFDSYNLVAWSLNGANITPYTPVQEIVVDNSSPVSTLTANWQLYLTGDSIPYDYVGRFCPPSPKYYIGDSASAAYYLLLQETTAFIIELNYDPTLLQMDSVENISPDTITGIDNSTPGLIRIAGQGNAGFQTVIRLYFTAIGSGDVPLETTVLSFTDPSGNPLLVNGNTPAGRTSLFRLRQPAYDFGDVDGNQAVNIVDALITAQYSVGLSVNSFTAGPGDVNLDGQVNIVDALVIAQHYVGLVPQLPLIP